MMHRKLFSRGLLLALPWIAVPALAADGHDLTFQGDAGFGGPHGGQAVEAALIDAESGEVLATQSGEVSADADPAFSLDFPGALEEGGSYKVNYWIDSNFGGGTVGSCDEPQQDHQWSRTIEMSDGAVSHVETHDPSSLTAVCDSFE
ncbi:hypothetical protein [Halomonas huangheensis]|nr:hypothetical protein [Halomonas huangheensis]